MDPIPGIKKPAQRDIVFLSTPVLNFLHDYIYNILNVTFCQDQFRDKYKIICTRSVMSINVRSGYNLFIFKALHSLQNEVRESMLKIAGKD